jgi:adenylosuccinate synthase
MLIEAESIEAIAKRVYEQDAPDPESFLLPNPVTRNDSGIRPNSASVEDTGLGDSGKGRLAQQMNADLIKVSPSGLLYSERYNGASNAGHEVVVKDTRGNDVKIALHQLPVAAVQEGATAILGRGMLVHPEDLVMEILYVENKIGAKLPARLIIDKNVTVTTDLHRAFEAFANKFLDAGAGNTASGVSQGYASYYEKRAITMEHLMANNWRDTFAKQYKYYASLMGGESVLAASLVKALTLDGKKEAHTVGTINEFLDRLEQARKILRPFVADARYEVEDIWKNNPDIPFTLESAQGPLLDPYGGLYPDNTASRPNGIVGISDSTEGVIQYNEIALKIAVLKTPYMSSVGARVHPYSMSPEIAQKYRIANGEQGKSTGRDRGIYPIDFVAMRAARRVAQYDYIAITHFDSNYPDIPIEIVVDYIDKTTGESEPYRPYQWQWDSVQGKVIQLPSWDGQAVAKAKTVFELPPESLKLMRLVHDILGPVAMVTNGAKLDQTIYLTK